MDDLVQEIRCPENGQENLIETESGTLILVGFMYNCALILSSFSLRAIMIMVLNWLRTHLSPIYSPYRVIIGISSLIMFTGRERIDNKKRNIVERPMLHCCKITGLCE